MRGIFAKIFFWFWFAMAMLGVAMVSFTLLSGSQPIGQRWMSRAIDLYARSAVDFYQHGGTPLLNRYLDDIAKSNGIHATLLDSQGRDIAARGLPPGAENLVRRAVSTGHTQIQTALTWSGASPIPAPEGNYVFVAQVHAFRGLLHAPDLGMALVRLAISLLAAGLLCALLARHIATPIRALQSAATRIAAGDLSVRATPAIGPRKDELADLARDFDRMADRIQSLLQKQQELLGDISHELRSPLARMSVSLELARRGDTEALEHMQSDLTRLDEFIGEILTLTRLQAQDQQQPLATVNLRTILEGVAEDARLEVRSGSKSVRFSQADDCWLAGDPNLLRSCFENVLRNAIRYTAPGTTVEIRLARSGSASLHAEISIDDSGPGVPNESLPRLFEPFFRVSESRERSTGGTGLGLAISQKVVTLYGGTIKAHNRENGGLSISISLPLQKSAQQEI